MKERHTNSTRSEYNSESSVGAHPEIYHLDTWKGFTSYDSFSAGSTVNYASNSSLGKPRDQESCKAHSDTHGENVEMDNNINNSSTVEDIQKCREEEKERFEALIQESVKEVHAASTAANNLGFSFSQEIKGIFTDLGRRLEDSHVHYMRHSPPPADQQRQELDCIVRKDEMINSLTDMLSKERSLSETQRELQMFKLNGILNQQHILKMKLAAKYSDLKLKQCYFNELRTNMLNGWKRRCESEARKKADETCRKLREHYKTAIDKLNDEIDSMKSTQLLEKAAYEETVQEGLMRGLRSLNLEALKVMNMRVSNQDVAKMNWDTPSDIFGSENAAEEHVNPRVQVVDVGEESMVLDQFIHNSSPSKPSLPADSTAKLSTPSFQIIKLSRMPMGLVSTKKRKP